MGRFLLGEWSRGLLLEYVFLEVVTVLLVRRDLAVAAKIGRLLLDAGELEEERAGSLMLPFDTEFAKVPGIRVVSVGKP
jgi:hypothetical protein